MKTPIPCCICDADTRVEGYTYGACNRCTKEALKRYAKVARPRKVAA